MHPSMKAWRIHEFGPPGVMQYEELARPDPGTGEVPVRAGRSGELE